jgi:hypothetical protein
MDKRVRWIPYLPGSEARASKLASLLRNPRVKNRAHAIAIVNAINKHYRSQPQLGETCGAKTRKGTPCKCKALRNGRCKLHGGMSTGPKTPAGKRQSAANLPHSVKITPARVMGFAPR